MEKGESSSPVYERQKSLSGSTTGNPTSPIMSPMNRHVRSGSVGIVNFRRTQNSAARAAAQRLARVMAHKQAEDESSEDDDVAALPPIELSTPRRANRLPSPAIGHYIPDQIPVQTTSIGRSTMSMKPSPMMPPTKPSPKPIASLPSEAPTVVRREKRMSLDFGNSFTRETAHSSRSSSTLQDEIDALQEENENILEKLRLAEERCEEAETRAKQLEKQVASLGEGVSLEARLLSRKEAALQQREAALKAAAIQRSVSRDEEIAALQIEAESAKEKVIAVVEHLLDAESEIKSLRTATQKMILNQEEMEELVLKRCWLARYWKLCVQHGIHSDIAEAKNDYWSSLAPLPSEVVLSAGQKSREGPSSGKADHEDNHRVTFGIIDPNWEENIESMLLVEKGLCELVSLKVEEAVLLSMAKHRGSNIKGSLFSQEGSNPLEAFELSQEECADVQFKQTSLDFQAWLTYIWRRVKNHGLEEDIADDRLQFWIDNGVHLPNSQDAVEVERALWELKKLGIESQLWEACRKGVNEDSSQHGSSTPSEI
ncbi:coiled-coil domain-containing protein SCD2-like isoform X2 [Phalaenopsis equestris]|uniref:coiled-coil domain-containing protein SCD2-like isoform X2 n=1 Tax=Phalaenopsis equestris TaxID=78828 RepID=UPI0009E1AE21|nr:coiled-coil domain-containing protein SCD2-like isoform X2 [Phalaenopsis equestris]